jgi:hypothetical protein
MRLLASFKKTTSWHESCSTLPLTLHACALLLLLLLLLLQLPRM